MASKISLPEGFKETTLKDYNMHQRSREILKNYCINCINQPSCEMNLKLQEAINAINAGNNRKEYWSEKFIAVTTPPIGNDHFDEEVNRVFCLEYKTQQLRFPKIPRQYSEGIERLKNLVENENRIAIEEERRNLNQY